MDSRKLKTFSVIVPIYNAQATIDKCIDSILSQTYKNIEIILVDDGSSDKSLDIILEYARNNKRIKIIKQKNSGVSTARNAGIKAAKGDWIVFIDSDDYVDDDYCDNLYNEYIRTGHTTIVCGYKYETSKKTIGITPVGRRIKTVSGFGDSIGELIDSKIFLSLWGKAYDHKIISKNSIKFKNGISLGEDLLFNLSYFQQECSFAISRTKGYHYTHLNNPNSLSKKPSLDRLRNSQLIYEESKKFCNKLNISEIAMPHFAKYYIKNIMYTFDLFANTNYYKKSDINNQMLRIIKNNTTDEALEYMGRQSLECAIYYFLLKPKKIWLIRILSNMRRAAKRASR